MIPSMCFSRVPLNKQWNSKFYACGARCIVFISDRLMNALTCMLLSFYDLGCRDTKYVGTISTSGDIVYDHLFQIHATTGTRIR